MNPSHMQSRHLIFHLEANCSILYSIHMTITTFCMNGWYVLPVNQTISPHKQLLFIGFLNGLFTDRVCVEQLTEKRLWSLQGRNAYELIYVL